MSRALGRRLFKLEDALARPPTPRTIPLLAEDDPDLERILAEHADQPFPSVIVMVGGKRKDDR
jgi:hypothetical protein